MGDYTRHGITFKEKLTELGDDSYYTCIINGIHFTVSRMDGLWAGRYYGEEIEGSSFQCRTNTFEFLAIGNWEVPTPQPEEYSDNFMGYKGQDWFNNNQLVFEWCVGNRNEFYLGEVHGIEIKIARILNSKSHLYGMWRATNQSGKDIPNAVHRSKELVFKYLCNNWEPK